MPNRAQICLVVIILALPLLSCTKQSEGLDMKTGDIAIENIPHADSIPLEWGNLVSVTTDDTWFQLWFQQADGNIRMAAYDIGNNRFWSHTILIHRK